MQKKTIGMLMLTGALLGASAQTDQVKAATTPTAIQSVASITEAKTFRYSYYDRTTDGKLIKTNEADITTDNPNPTGGAKHGLKNIVDVQPDGPIVDGVQGFRVVLERMTNSIYFNYFDEDGNEIDYKLVGLHGWSRKVEPGMAVYQKEVAHAESKISQLGFQIVSQTVRHTGPYDEVNYVLTKNNSDAQKPETGTESSSLTGTDNQKSPEKNSESSMVNEVPSPPHKGEVAPTQSETPKPVDSQTGVMATGDASNPGASQGTTTGNETVVSPDSVAGNEAANPGQTSNVNPSDVATSTVSPAPNTVTPPITPEKPHESGTETPEAPTKQNVSGSTAPKLPLKPTTSSTSTATTPTKPNASGTTTPTTPVAQPTVGATTPALASKPTEPVKSVSKPTRPVSTAGSTNQARPTTTVKPTTANRGTTPTQIKVEVQPVEQTGSQTTSSKQTRKQTKRQVKPTKTKHKQVKHKQTKHKGKQQTKRTVKGKSTQTKKKTTKQTRIRQLQQQLVKLLKQLLALQK
ncbi:hypothetical protein GCM10022296_14460 [Secundilactobacillus similis DSM 23365 = JCM 2765]|uniref:MucBP domain-containing protein n=2 Tax=Secundilactobacillus similis TaxID=414682 RepID=A0A0R2EV71_9LACO|nr:hypothetical protein [Secundilactobacillus similis]KRN20344.1 hypothetical protein FD14_GL001502 [Secundilactobacillus similis DSM 23365 = JCM 2765]